MKNKQCMNENPDILKMAIQPYGPTIFNHKLTFFETFWKFQWRNGFNKCWAWGQMSTLKNNLDSKKLFIWLGCKNKHRFCISCDHWQMCMISIIKPNISSRQGLIFSVITGNLTALYPSRSLLRTLATPIFFLNYIKLRFPVDEVYLILYHIQTSSWWNPSNFFRTQNFLEKIHISFFFYFWNINTTNDQVALVTVLQAAQSPKHTEQQYIPHKLNHLTSFNSPSFE